MQAGSGVLTLTASNTYTGGTTVASGTLQVGSGTAAGSLGPGPVIANGALVFDLSAATTFCRAIGGNGSLTQAGTSVLTLLGNSSFSAAAWRSPPEPCKWATARRSSSTDGVLDNGSFVVNRSDSQNLRPVVSGSGDLLQAGTGILTLLGANTYSGATTISAGTLQVGNGGSGASIATSAGVLDNGVLIFNHNDGAEYDGVISGSGSLAQAGLGILTLGGSNTYSGPTTVSAGTLEIGNGGGGEFLASPSVTLATSAAALVFDQGDTLTYSGTIGGSGSLRQLGRAW